jgi:hypothetical protein
MVASFLFLKFFSSTRRDVLVHCSSKLWSKRSIQAVKSTKEYSYTRWDDPTDQVIHNHRKKRPRRPVKNVKQEKDHSRLKNRVQNPE